MPLDTDLACTAIKTLSREMGITLSEGVHPHVGAIDDWVEQLKLEITRLKSLIPEWKPIAEIPEELKDGRPLLLLAEDNERFVGIWVTSVLREIGWWELFGARARIDPVFAYALLPDPPKKS